LDGRGVAIFEVFRRPLASIFYLDSVVLG